MEAYSVFVPQLLPRSEPFTAGARACPGCGQALAARIIAKAMELHRGRPWGASRVRIESAMLPYAGWPEFGEARGRKHPRAAGRPREALAIAGDAGTFEEMFARLAAARAQGCRMLYICFMNEAGIRRSPAGQADACGPDHLQPLRARFDDMHGMIRRVREADPDFMATASPSYPFDLMEKIGMALACPGISMLAVLVSCPTGCLYDADLSVHSGRLAVESGFFPLYHAHKGGALRMLRQPERPIADYIRHQQACPRPTAREVSRVEREAKALRRRLHTATHAHAR